jgi:two-component system chemotaxis response regulator CheB
MPEAALAMSPQAETLTLEQIADELIKAVQS